MNCDRIRRAGTGLRVFSQGRDGDLGRVPGQQVHVVVLVVEVPQLRAEASRTAGAEIGTHRNAA